LADEKFTTWLGELRGGAVPDNVKVRWHPASHLCYTFHFEGGDGIHVKFYGIPTGSVADYDGAWAMENEYKILKKVYEQGFAGAGYGVTTPLGSNPELYAALATEYVSGSSLAILMQRSIGRGKNLDRITESLGKAGVILKKIHETMPRSKRISMLREAARLSEETLLGFTDENLRKRISNAIQRVRSSREIATLGAVTVHGDANPSNFIVKRSNVYAIDFETLEAGRSPLLDLGYMIADVKHHFKLYGGSAAGARKAVNAFARAYAGDDAKRILHLARPYVGCGLLRISKFINDHGSHRKWLLREGFRNLR